MQDEILTREFAFERSKFDESKREVDLAFSSETPVLRGFGYEVLSHAPGSVDLSRLKSLLWNHDANEFIGGVKNPQIGSDGKARATVRFGNSERAKTVAADVRDGVLETVSVGYQILDMERTGEHADGQPIFTATAWRALEVSFVAVPADNNVGVNRGSHGEIKKMKVDQMTDLRADELTAIGTRLAGKVPNIEAMVTRAILDGTSVEDFRRAMLEVLPTTKAVRTIAPLDVKPEEWSKYSISTIALGANGAAFSVANARNAMISLETAVSTSNADEGNLAYLTNSKMRGRLKQIDQSQATNTAQWVWSKGQVNDYAAHVSNQVSSAVTQGTATTICSNVYFGNWQDVLIAQFNNGATDLLVDPYTLGANAVIRVIARHWVDLAIRHPASFSVLLGALDA